MLDHTQQSAEKAAGKEVMMVWSWRGQVIDPNHFDRRSTAIHSRNVCPLLLLLGSKVVVL